MPAVALAYFDMNEDYRTHRAYEDTISLQAVGMALALFGSVLILAWWLRRRSQ